MKKKFTGAEIRQSYIDFFVSKGHTFVPSSSLVPGGDQTLLFTNAGMVQFKDVFLGEDQRPYKRAANSQKCMRVAGKHNDLDDVGRDNSHHTFFEMMGNWSFGDYYKKEAIAWAWELLTEVWGLEKDILWTTCFKDEKGEIPADDEAAKYWKEQPGINPDQVLYCGRKDNFWEMADTGPCGPCSEIHIDLGPEFCDKKDVPGHECKVNGDCKRYLELWNLVFMQYNRLGPSELIPLPACHVDTGLGLERVVAIMQEVYSNYKTDLFLPILDVVQEMTGHTVQQREENLTPYRVIADHGRAATFLIADGVVPGNIGRNYVCRMIIRRAARFGSKIGLNEPFLARVANVIIDEYGAAYPEIAKNRKTICDSLTREEKQFQKTVEAGLSHLEEMITELEKTGGKMINGDYAFDLYATHGVPLEITRDIVHEKGFDVDEEGFKAAMENHRIKSGAGKAFGPLGGEEVDIYRAVYEELLEKGKLGEEGVSYDPYTVSEVEGEVLAIIRESQPAVDVNEGDEVEVVLPETCFYVESGGQVSDTGTIVKAEGTGFEMEVYSVKKPATGIIVHTGKIIKGKLQVGDVVIANVDIQRRHDIMRNHTATHLLHAQLHEILGEHARQAGSLVAPDRLRFDFTHPEAVTAEQIEMIEDGVNRAIMEDYQLDIKVKTLSEAMEEGATALFGEKYAENVRTIKIGKPDPFSYELCGGTHVSETGDIGLFLITSEGSAAAGIRRIEAVTGRGAYEVVKKRTKALKTSAAIMGGSLDEVAEKVQVTVEHLDQAYKEINRLHQRMASVEFEQALENVPQVNGIPVLSTLLHDTDADVMRQLADRFRQKYPSGIFVSGSAVADRPVLIAAITDDLVKKGFHAGNLIKEIASIIGGSGGGKPTLAQAGGKDAGKLKEALDQVVPYVKNIQG